MVTWHHSSETGSYELLGQCRRKYTSYVHVDQLRSRDERSMQQVAKTEETPISVALDQNTKRDKAAVEE